MVAMRHIYIFTSSALTENRMRPNAQVFREYLTTHEFFINIVTGYHWGFCAAAAASENTHGALSISVIAMGTCLPNTMRSPPLITDVLCVQDQK